MQPTGPATSDPLMVSRHFAIYSTSLYIYSISFLRTGPGTPLPSPSHSVPQSPNVNQSSASSNFNFTLPPVSTFTKSPAVPQHGDVPPAQFSPVPPYSNSSGSYPPPPEQWLPYPGPQGFIGRPVFLNW
jgi:hypothetical protein